MEPSALDHYLGALSFAQPRLWSCRAADRAAAQLRVCVFVIQPLCECEGERECARVCMAVCAWLCLCLSGVSGHDGPSSHLYSAGVATRCSSQATCRYASLSFRLRSDMLRLCPDPLRHSACFPDFACFFPTSVSFSPSSQ